MYQLNGPLKEAIIVKQETIIISEIGDGKIESIMCRLLGSF